MNLATPTLSRLKRGILFAVLQTMLLAVVSCASAHEWRPLFNGKDLDGWTPKFTGVAVGENYADTFRVEEGLLKARYDNYPKNDAGDPLFENHFGHLFFTGSIPGSEVDPLELSHYRLRVEYRFVGKQAADGQDWAAHNSGVMVHGQRPETMTRDQDFPDSIEVQLLGGLGEGTGPRPTANLCTPGTHVEMDGKLFTPHCTKSSSPTFHGDPWVTVEIEVLGNRSIRHFVNGTQVLEYARPQLEKPGPKGPVMLIAGSISVQSESHPVDFRRIEIQLLETP